MQAGTGMVCPTHRVAGEAGCHELASWHVRGAQEGNKDFQDEGGVTASGPGEPYM